MNGRRIVTVVLPDVDQCERTLRYAAEKMCHGVDIMVIDLSPIIPDAIKPSLFAKLNEAVRDCAGQVRHHLDQNVHASLTRN